MKLSERIPSSLRCIRRVWRNVLVKPSCCSAIPVIITGHHHDGFLAAREVPEAG